MPRKILTGTPKRGGPVLSLARVALESGAGESDSMEMHMKLGQAGCRLVWHENNTAHRAGRATCEFLGSSAASISGECIGLSAGKDTQEFLLSTSPEWDCSLCLIHPDPWASVLDGSNMELLPS